MHHMFKMMYSVREHLNDYQCKVFSLAFLQELI